MLALLDVNKYNISSMKLMWYGASAMLLEILRKGTETFGPILPRATGRLILQEELSRL